MSKGILGIGDSFMWGESLYFYSDLPNLPFNENHKFDFDTMTEGFVGYKNKYRFIQLVADHYNTWCTVRALNGSTNESNLNFINQFNYTDVIQPNDTNDFNFKLDINEYKLVIFIFTSHIRDKSEHLINDVLKEADTVFSRFEEMGIKVCTLCWYPEWFNTDIYRHYYVNKNRHTPLIHNNKIHNWYEDLCYNNYYKLSIKSDFAKKGFQKNDMHFNKQGNKMLAESIIKKLNQEKFTINNNLI